MLETATDKIFCFRLCNSLRAVSQFLSISPVTRLQSAFPFVFSIFFRKTQKNRRVAERRRHNGSQRMATETNDEKSIRVIEAKIIFYSSSKQRFLTQKKGSELNFFAGFGAIDGMKHTVPVHVFNFILFFSNRRRDERKNSVRRISTIHSKQQEKTFCDVEDNKNTLRCILYAHTYTNFASRYLRKHM